MTEDQAIHAAYDLLCDELVPEYARGVIEELAARLDTRRTYGTNFAEIIEAIQDVDRGIRTWAEVQTMASVEPVALEL